MEQFYREFVAVYPEEDAFNITLIVLEDLLRSNDEEIQLAAIRCLGNFVLYVIFDPILPFCY